MVAVEPWTRSRGNGLILVLIAPVPSFLYHFLELIFCREAGLGLQRSTFCACTTSTFSDQLAHFREHLYRLLACQLVPAEHMGEL